MCTGKLYNPKMRLFTTVFLVLLLLPVNSYSQEELKICEEGMDKCQPLVADAEKYSRCMRLTCHDYYSEAARKEKDLSKFYFKPVAVEQPEQLDGKSVKTCEYGLRKCDVLRNNVEFYWECVQQNCLSQPKNVRPDCDLGINACTDKQLLYNDCMNLMCGDPAATMDDCPAAQAACNESLRSYWHCVYGICLGPVDEFKRPASEKLYMVVQDNKGVKRRVQVNKKKPIFHNAPAVYRQVPEGVDPEEWVRDTPQKFLLRNNPSSMMRCMMPAAMLSCSVNDARSCYCSDGTRPIMLNIKPGPPHKD